MSVIVEVKAPSIQVAQWNTDAMNAALEAYQVKTPLYLEDTGEGLPFTPVTIGDLVGVNGLRPHSIFIPRPDAINTVLPTESRPSTDEEYVSLLDQFVKRDLSAFARSEKLSKLRLQTRLLIPLGIGAFIEKAALTDQLSSNLNVRDLAFAIGLPVIGTFFARCVQKGDFGPYIQNLGDLNPVRQISDLRRGKAFMNQEDLKFVTLK